MRIDEKEFFARLEEDRKKAEKEAAKLEKQSAKSDKKGESEKEVSEITIG